jgi:hypothetical protein
MGWRSNLKAITALAEADLDDAGQGATMIRSPWQVGNLNPLVFQDIWGTASPIGRTQAMSLPGVYRARAILLSLIADKPLQAWAGDTLAPKQASFLYRTPGQLGPWQRMAYTIDDLIFYGCSLWMTERGAEVDGRRPILNATRCPWDRWTFDEWDRICLIDLDGTQRVADDSEVLLIPGASEGLLAYATRTITGAANLEAAWVQRASTPQALTELHLTDDTQLDDDEILATRDQYVSARQAVNGAVTVTPSNVEVIDHGSTDAQLFIEGRNYSRMDIAAFFNLPAAILDATTAQASLTYVTQEGTRTSVYDLSLPYWVRPIEARLSQDDVVPYGQSVRFDFTSLTAQTQIVTED